MRGRPARVTFAHMPGACGLFPSHDGRFALTSGSDATIRAHDIRDTPQAWWRSCEAPEPELPELSVADMHEKAVGCLVLDPHSSTLATGSDDGFVRLFALKAEDKEELVVDGELVQACARFGGPVRAVDFSPTGSFLAAAGDEPGVLKIIMTAQPSNVTVLRAPKGEKGSEAAVAIAFDHTGDFIATVGEKGQGVIWDADRCKLLCAVDLESRNAKCVTWSPDGSKLVFGTDKGIAVVSRDSWRFDCLLEDASDQDDDEDEIYSTASGKDLITALCWSNNGRYLVAARDDSNVSLWNVEEKKVLACWRAEEVAQRIYWHPTANAIMLIDKIGQWGLIPDVVPDHMPSPHSDSTPVDIPTFPEAEPKSKRNAMDGDFADNEKDIGRIKQTRADKARKKQRVKRAEDKMVEAADREKKGVSHEETREEEEEGGEELENGFTFNASDVDADQEQELRRGEDNIEESDEESASDEEMPGELADLENGGVKLPARRGKHPRASNASWQRSPKVLSQPPFNPTSTPLSEKATRKRHILAWNLVGAVLSFDESSHDVVEIEFSDASKRSVGIKDHFGYTMGCLTDRGVFLASPKSKEHGSLITFRPFSSWSNNSDWTQYLPADENALVVALGGQFAAVVTAPNNLVRLFSLSGIQTSVFGMQGNIVSAAASGDKLVLVYAEPESAVLKCELLEINAFGEIQKVRFCGQIMLCPGARLEWIGFTNDTRELCTYDSNGWFWLMIDPQISKRWIPVVQNAAKAGECDWFWVASATSTHVIGAPCLSSERFPTAKPRPALRTIPLSAPVIDKVTKSGKPTIMERFMRTKYRLNRALCAKADADELYDSDGEEVLEAEDDVARMEVETDKCLLALMEEACRNEQNMRALDLACRLHSKVSFKYAVELAKHFKRNALANRVEQVALAKTASIEQDAQARNIADKAVGNSSPVTPVSRGGMNENDGDDSHYAAAPVNSARRTISKPRMKLDVDVRDAPPANVAGNVQSRDIGVADVTDDEDDGAHQKPETEPLPESCEGEQAPALVEKLAVTQRKKRPQSVPASQASAKLGGDLGSSRVVKKSKVVKADKQKDAAAGKRKFHNRFLRK